jgi:hypothetical protein
MLLSIIIPHQTYLFKEREQMRNVVHEDKNNAVKVRIKGDFFNLTPFGNKREHDGDDDG